MRHFDAWLVRDPYSIWHYYTTGRKWQDQVCELIHDRAICSPAGSNLPSHSTPASGSISPHEDGLGIDWTKCTPQQAPLLTQLPPEIRTMIWSYVFGSSTLHLVQIKDKIKHVRCTSTSSSSNNNNSKALTHHRHCCPKTPARWRIYDGRIPGHTDRLLYPHTHADLPSTLSTAPVALLRTCKAIYAETQTTVYKNNTIDVDDLFTFLSFVGSLSPRARRAITSLTVQWMPVWTPLSGQEHKGSIYAHTHSDELWVRFWDCIARELSGLRCLKLSIDLGRFSGTMVGGGAVLVGGGQRLRLDVAEGWVRPLLKVRGLDEFDLAVTARCDGVSRGVIEGDLVRDVLRLRGDLRGVMVGERGVDSSGFMDLDVGDDVPVAVGRRKRVLAITAG